MNNVNLQNPKHSRKAIESPNARSAFAKAGRTGKLAMATFLTIASVALYNLLSTGCTDSFVTVTSYVHDTVTVVKDASKKEYQALLTLQRNGVTADTLVASAVPQTIRVGGAAYGLSVINGGVDARTNQRAVLVSIQPADSTQAATEQWLVLNSAKDVLTLSANGETVELVLTDASLGMTASQSQDIFLRISYNGKPLSIVSLAEGGHRVITTYEDSDQTDITVSDSVTVQSLMTGQKAAHAKINGRNLVEGDSIKLGSGLFMSYLGNGVEDAVNPASGSLTIASDTTTFTFSIPAVAMDTSIVIEGNLWQLHSDGIKILYLSGEQIGAASDQVTLSDTRGNSASKGVGFYGTGSGAVEYILHYGGLSVQLSDAVSSTFGKVQPVKPDAGTPPQ